MPYTAQAKQKIVDDLIIDQKLIAHRMAKYILQNADPEGCRNWLTGLDPKRLEFNQGLIMNWRMRNDGKINYLELDEKEQARFNEVLAWAKLEIPQQPGQAPTPKKTEEKPAVEDIALKNLGILELIETRKLQIENKEAKHPWKFPAHNERLSALELIMKHIKDPVNGYLKADGNFRNEKIINLDQIENELTGKMMDEKNKAFFRSGVQDPSHTPGGWFGKFSDYHDMKGKTKVIAGIEEKPGKKVGGP